MDNFIYKGSIRHRRFTPFLNIFNYNTFMVFFDIRKIENIFNKSFLFSTNKFAIASYLRSDYHGDKGKSLDWSVRNTIKNETGIEINGPIRLLTHLRYFGYCFNPVSFYYCYNKNDTKLKMIMAEVTNTPWNERHCYFITNKKNKNFNQNHKKEFHVSPFWEMDHDYNWNFSIPDKSISIHMQNFKNSNRVFDATLSLKNRVKLTKTNLFFHSLRYPFITLMVFFRIHAQALKLWVKGATFYDHPKYKEEN